MGMEVFMQRKICSIGNSRGVSIPGEVLDKLNLKKGSEVDIKVDEKNNVILIEPVRSKTYPKGLDREFVSQVNDFINKYRPALKELAKK
jgi:putative addiction module antidote